MKIVEMVEIIRNATGCDQNTTFIAAADIKPAEVKERLDGRKQARLKK